LYSLAELLGLGSHERISHFRELLRNKEKEYGKQQERKENYK
jgi:hypothetical protein